MDTGREALSILWWKNTRWTPSRPNIRTWALGGKISRGLKFHHKPTHLLITGAIDDVWINPKGEYIIVDTKATAKEGDITALDKAWHDGTKRQMEMYLWLFRQNGFPVSDTGYFVYANGRAMTSLSSLTRGRRIGLRRPSKPPQSGPDCDYCAYTLARGEKL